MRRNDTPSTGARLTNVSSSVVARSGVSLKSASEIEAIRRAGRVAAGALAAAEQACVAGATTRYLADAAGRVIDSAGGQAIFRNYRLDGAPPFGAAACVSVNDEIVHGLPGERVLIDGDIVTVDVGVRLDGWCADAAKTFVVGEATADLIRLVEGGRRALYATIAAIRPGVRWSEASAAGEAIALDAGLLALRGWAGHGIGRDLHEGPALPLRPRADRNEDVVLEAGMTLAIEPIVALPASDAASRAYADGSYTFGSTVRPDGWTVVSLNGWLTCHFEHTVAVTDRAGVVLSAA